MFEYLSHLSEIKKTNPGYGTAIVHVKSIEQNTNSFSFRA